MQKYVSTKFDYLQIAGNYRPHENILDVPHCIEDENGIYEDIEICETINMWKDTYKELYTLLLDIVSGPPTTPIDTYSTDINSLCAALMNGLNEIYIKSIRNEQVQMEQTQRNQIQKEQDSINHNMRFIINIASILIGEIDAKITDTKINYGSNKVFTQDGFYILEDAIKSDYETFFREYDKLAATKHSIFFYRSNLTNISTLLKCLSTNCMMVTDETDGTGGTDEQKRDKLKKKTFYSSLQQLIKDNNLLPSITREFTTKKYVLIKLLLESYKNFSYNKIKYMYIAYLKFYNDAFKDLPFDLSNNTPEIIKNLIDQISRSGEDYFVYLSCILPTEVNFMKFEMSKMLISYLGFRYNDDKIYHSVDIITHDFDALHYQYKRKILFDQQYINEMRVFLIRLHRYFALNKTTFENIIKFIHNSNYENGITTKTANFMAQIIDKCIINRSILKKYIENLFNNNYHEILSVFPGRRALVFQQTENIKLRIKQETDATFSTEINKFIEDINFRMDLNTPLGAKIILYKYIVIPNFNDIYLFMMFLKDFYHVFIDSILLQNMDTIAQLYDNL